MNLTFDYPTITVFDVPFSWNPATLVFPHYVDPFKDLLCELSEAYRLDPRLGFALIDFESGWGTRLKPVGPGGTADNGHGHGLGQIDDRTWGVWLNVEDWKNPRTNLFKSFEILTDYHRQVLSAGLTGSLAAWTAISAYNAGTGPAIKRAKLDGDPNAVTWHDATHPPRYCNEVWKRYQPQLTGSKP